MIGDRPIRIEVDGGITAETAALCAAAGADALVAGNAVFKDGPSVLRQPHLRRSAPPPTPRSLAKAA